MMDLGFFEVAVNTGMNQLIPTFLGTVTQVCFVQTLQLDMPPIGNIWTQAKIGQWGEERKGMREMYGDQSS